MATHRHLWVGERVTSKAAPIRRVTRRARPTGVSGESGTESYRVAAASGEARRRGSAPDPKTRTAVHEKLGKSSQSNRAILRSGAVT